MVRVDITFSLGERVLCWMQISSADFADGREIIEVTPHALFRLLSSASCGVFVLASDQTAVFWNRRVREILGYTPDRVLGRRSTSIASEVEGFALTGDCEEGCPMMRRFRTDQAPGRARIRMRCSWGAWKWLSVTPWWCLGCCSVPHGQRHVSDPNY